MENLGTTPSNILLHPLPPEDEETRPWGRGGSVPLARDAAAQVPLSDMLRHQAALPILRADFLPWKWGGWLMAPFDIRLTWQTRSWGLKKS